MKSTVLGRGVEWPSKNGDVAIHNMTDDHIRFTIGKLFSYAEDRTIEYDNGYIFDGMDTNVRYTDFTIREWIHALQREQKQRKREIKKARSIKRGLAASKKRKTRSYK